MFFTNANVSLEQKLTGMLLACMLKWNIICCNDKKKPTVYTQQMADRWLIVKKKTRNKL